MLQRSVFGEVPGLGRWQTVLLIDGNIGIGGDPVCLLRRLRELLSNGGQVLAEVECDRTGMQQMDVRVERDGEKSVWAKWASVGSDAIATISDHAMLKVIEMWTCESRTFVAMVAA